MSPVVIAYHAVGTCPAADDPHDLYVPRDAFDRQMSWLARRRTVVPLAEVVAGRAPRGAVAITFDDAYRSVLETAAPVLGRLGLPATVFAPTAWLGRPAGWLDPSPCDFTIMTAEELVAVERAGVAVESHGHGHIDVSAVGEQAALDDVVASLDSLAAVLGRRATMLAWPFGPSSAGARAAAERAGLAAAFSIDALGDGRFAMERVPITPHDSMALFAVKCSGLYLRARHGRVGSAVWRLARRAARRNRRR